MKIPDWLRRLFTGESGEPRRRRLTCMRLADMIMVHPNQIERPCSICGETVGIYPSGQSVVEHFPGQVDIVCQHCCPAIGVLAPGAEDEPFESVPRNRQHD